MSKTSYNDIFSYIKAQETAYRLPIKLTDSWDWSMKDHIETTVAYTNSQLINGKDDWTPVKNITRPILNLQHRTEDIELKDVEIYVDDPNKYGLSFLVKKYHDDVFVQENNLDTFFDELNTSRIDFGVGLSKMRDTSSPEVVPLEDIAFCNQRDILSSPFGLKYYFSPDELLDMADKGWGKESNGATKSLEEVVWLYHEDEKADDNGIVVYEVHGKLPKKFANRHDNSGEYETRLFLVTFYTPKESDELEGIILYTQPEKKLPFKLIKRDKIQGARRALGWGGAEELFEAQVWTNYDMIRMQNMLDAAATTVILTNDPSLAAKHPTGLKGMKPLEFIDEAIGGNTRQLDTFPRNISLFEKSVAEWEAHAQQMGAANDSIMGESPASGTPFKLQELVTQESHGLHEYRRQQYAKHIEEIYRDWIIPHIVKKITEGAQWLSELSLDEINYVADSMVNAESNKKLAEMVLAGEEVNSDIQQTIQDVIREDFKKGGNKRFLEILKGEFKGINLGVKVSVAGKSKDLAKMTDKIVNIFRFAFSNPQGFAQTMQIPGMAKSFNDILEFSGLSPVDFSGIDKAMQSMAQPQQPQQAPQQALPAPMMQNA